MKVAYLGPEKTYSGDMTRILFSDAQLSPIQPIRNVVQAVEDSEADLGVVPLENFYTGGVRRTLDALTKCRYTRIIKEAHMRIVHCLGTLSSHGKIENIFSHGEALEQCSDYLQLNYPHAIEISTPSTAAAPERINAEKLLNAAAIASRKALLESKLEILAENIVPKNKTRFAVISRSRTEPTRDDKTLLAIHPSVSDKPGVLYRALGFFANLDINLEDIGSRPDGDIGYYFYIELDGHENDRTVQTALAGLKLSLDPKGENQDRVKILGSYPNTHWKDDN